MNDKDILISHALDMKEKCADNSMITNTNFLSLEELSTVKTIERQYNAFVRTYYYGGYDDAERQIALFVPSFNEIDEIGEYLRVNDEENPLCIVRLTKDRFTQLSHRDYLGAIMALGIKREIIGDIKVRSDGCDVFCLKSIAGYIGENLRKSGRGSVRCEVLPVGDFSGGDEKTEIKFYSVASLRLDNIVSAAFNVSRSVAFEAINKGLVYVNSSECFKSDFSLKEGDKVVFRGKGKAILWEIIGENKKGRVHINIKKYL